MRPARADDAAITGVGLVTPIGVGVEAVRAALASGAAASAAAAGVPPPWLSAVVPEALEAQAKFLSPSGQLAATAVAEALEAARRPATDREAGTGSLYLAQVDFTPIDYAAYRAAIVDATDGHTRPATSVLEALNVASVRKMNPFFLLESLNNNAFSLLSAWHGLRGPNTSTSGWSNTGLSAVALAARTVSRGEAPTAVACGSGRFAVPVAELEAAHRHATPPGEWPGDGAGALVFERLEAARARGLAPRSVLLGWGAAFGAREGGGADASAWAHAAREALEEAGAGVEDAVDVLAPDVARARAALAGLPALASSRFESLRARLGHAGPGSDLIDAGFAATCPGSGATLVLAEGLEGAVTAVLLASA